MDSDRDLGNFRPSAPELAAEPAPAPEPEPVVDELDDPEVLRRLDELAGPSAEVDPMATSSPDAIVRAVFGRGQFVRGWAPKSAGTDPISGFSGHPGVDVSMPQGTPIYALAGGTVDFAGDAGGRSPSSWSTAARAVAVNGGGLTVSIAGGDKDNTRHQYSHLSKLLVASGQKVNPGDLIGYSGSTGISTGPHLQFVLRQGKGAGQAIDPMPFLAGIASTGWSPAQAAATAQARANEAQAAALQAQAARTIAGASSGGSQAPAPVQRSGLSGDSTLLIAAAMLAVAILVVLVAAPRRSEAPA